MQLHEFSDKKSLNVQLANRIKDNLQNALERNNQAFLAVSGGKSPIELFEILSHMALDWDKITIVLVDERCVDKTHTDSNERLVKDYLLKQNAKNASLIGLHHDPEDLKSLEAQIASLPPFDVVILGMGEDGHTASLFPCSEELKIGLDEEAKSIVKTNPKSAPYQRISLTKKRLCNSHAIFLPLIGSKKQAVFNKALLNTDPMIMPISAFLHNNHINMQVMYAPE